MMTGKQERNQVPGPAVTHNPAIAGPDETAAIARAYSSSTAAGASGPAITGHTSFGSNPDGGA
jgi:hypothetical protein